MVVAIQDARKDINIIYLQNNVSIVSIKVQIVMVKHN